MEIGQMRHLLQRQTLQESADSYGQLIPSWLPQEKVFGYVEGLTGKEAINAMQVRSESTHKITMRWLAGLSTTDRFIFDGRILNVLWIKDTDGHQRHLEVLVQEVITSVTGGEAVPAPVPSAKGVIDTSFAIDGFNTTTPGTKDQIGSIAIQSDGKVVAGGYATVAGLNVFALARYNTDGSLDTSFATNGFSFITPGVNDRIFSIAIQSDGKIVAGGFATDTSYNQVFALGRYNTDGSIDTSFATNGFSTTTPGNTDNIYSIAIQSDGKIVVGGSAYISSNVFALARYNTDGSIDTSFATNGFNTTTPGSIDFIRSIAIQSDGKIVAGGYARDTNRQDVFALARYNTNGSLDTTFATNGFSTTTPGNTDFIRSIAIQSDGKIVVGGYTHDMRGNNIFALARYNTDGSLDTTFASNGFNIVSPSTNDYIYSIAIQADGKIVAGGYAYGTMSSALVFALARYNTGGSIDTTFAIDGFSLTNPSTNGYIYSIAIQSDDGKIVAGGYAEDTNYNQIFALARYE